MNEDVKEIRDDIHKFQTAITADVRELTVQVKGILSSIRILAVLTLSSLAGSIWWGATLTADVRHLESRMNEKFREVDVRFDKLESKMDARFDKLEAAIGKLAEQLKAGREPAAAK